MIVARERLPVIPLVVALGGCAAPTGDAPPEDDAPPGMDAPMPRAGGPGGRGAAAGGAGGVPAAGGAGGAAPAPRPDGGAEPAAPAAPIAAAVVISEVMYHPVLDEALGEPHEFIELHNRTAGTVSLAGWSLAGSIRFTFPMGASLAPRQYLVVARDRARLAALHRLDPASVLGDYEGNLDNGGGRVQLVDARGALIDSVKYDDKFPWPYAADALGAGEAWLPAALAPLEKHRGRGVSLERVGLDVPSEEIADWAPSAVDGMTPGKPNGAAGPPRPIVEALEAGRAGGAGSIRAADQVRIRVRFSARGEVREPQVEWFVDALDRADESRTNSALARAGELWEAVLPPQPANALVRYRIVGDAGGGRGAISPRPSDPFAWHAYFVSPEVATTARLYHLFIAPRDWGQMLKNVEPGQVPRGQCAPNPPWNARVPATLVHEGAVCDVQVRYHGGYIHRLEGPSIPGFAGTPPLGGPNPPRALGLKVKFPRWRPFDGRRSISLNKLNQSCPGIDSYVAAKLEGAVGVPATNVRFVRVHVNGGYYHYMMELEDLREELLERHHPGVEVGDLFKSNGSFGNLGPFGPGDESQLAPACNFPPLERYRWTYKRRTHDHRDHAVLAKLIDDLAAARRQGAAALRAFLRQSFHVDLVLSHLAVINWAGAWDENVHNHFLYRWKDRWLISAWDYDQLFGGGAGIDGNALQSASASFYSGEQGDPNNKLGWNLVKDAFLKAYRAEFHQRLHQLSTTVLAPAAVIKLADEGLAAFSLTDWMQAPARKVCDVRARTETIRRWARDRDAALRMKVPQ